MMTMWGIFNQFRCKLAYWLANCGIPNGLKFGLKISPSTTSLIRHRRRNPPPLIIPKASHLIYHQQTVDQQAGINCLKTLVPQLPEEDEVLFLDIGGTFGVSACDLLKKHEWCTYSSAKASLPEQQSYTYGMNLGMLGLKGSNLFVWRTDYIYPNDIMKYYSRFIINNEFVCPYNILVGNPYCDSSFVQKNWDRAFPFQEEFWSQHARLDSLYKTQDPALFAIRKELWNKVGGLNHELWGYGWQFAEFAARIRIHCQKNKICYFGGPTPLHQTHSGSLMHNPEEKAVEASQGVDRFKSFLGGDEPYWVYRSKQLLADINPKK